MVDLFDVDGSGRTIEEWLDFAWCSLHSLRLCVITLNRCDQLALFESVLQLNATLAERLILQGG